MSAAGAYSKSTERSSDPLVRVEDLEVHFQRRGRRRSEVVRAVDGVSLEIQAQETLGLVGESGCGKSTLGRAVIRLLQPTAGAVHFDGIDLGSLDTQAMRRMRRRMQVIFQDPYGSLNPRMTIGQTLEEPLLVHHLARGEEAKDRVWEILAAVGLPEGAGDRYPHEFSGGQRQRAAIARALMSEPDLIVADEAVSALDVSIRAQIVNLLRRLQRDFGLTYLFIAHDLAVVRHVSDRIAVMYLGQVVELAATDDLHATPLHPYTASLLSAIPVPDPAREKRRERIILTGDVPSPIHPPSGCRFHPRCWLRSELEDPEICAAEEPSLRQVQVHGRASSVACHFAEEMIPRSAGLTIQPAEADSDVVGAEQVSQ